MLGVAGVKFETTPTISEDPISQKKLTLKGTEKSSDNQ